MKPRIILIFIAFVALWSLVIARAAFLQFLPHERLEARKNKQYETSIVLSSLRGSIKDRHGKELALSVAAYSLFADPSLIDQDTRVARKLGRELRMSEYNLKRKFSNKKDRFVWIRRHLTKEQKDRIDSWGYRGLAFIEEPKRIYPNEELLAQTLGFTGRSGKGLEGLELRHNQKLLGSERRIPVRRDARGRPLYNENFLFAEMPNGSEVELTIDLELQDLLESELARAVKVHEAAHAVGVILDPRTSAVLALATSPTYNPNEPLTASSVLRRNRAITDSFEPGSTMKTFAIAAALRSKLIRPNTKYFCENGSFEIGGRTIRESDKKHKWKQLTVTEILAKSSNIGTTKVAFDVGDKRYHQALLDFGFGKETGIDFPGESKGILHAPPWRKHLLSNISFGHGIAVTPLQIANAYAAIANGGVLHKPYLVKSLRNRSEGIEEVTEPQDVRRVLSPEDAEKLRLMLTAVTGKDGTGANARVPGFPVAGKTGTAQKVNPNGRGYLEGEYISSFAGFLPAHDPRFVIYIAVDSPQKGYYGSQVAAPVFQAIASFAVRKAGLTPILLNEGHVYPTPPAELDLALENNDPASLQSVLQKVKADSALSEVPALKGLTIREVMQKLRGHDVNLKVQGTGKVQRTSPPEGKKLARSKNLTVYLQ